MFLTHFSPRYEDEEEILLEQAKEVFPDAVLACDLDEHVVTYRD